MTEKNIGCSRYIENFNPMHNTTELVHEVCESVADAFLAQIEYGKDYVINTNLVKEDWAGGLGTKYTHYLRFDELVRCKDCKHAYEDRLCTSTGWVDVLVCESKQWSTSSLMPSHKVEPDGFCSCGERKVVEQ